MVLSFIMHLDREMGLCQAERAAERPREWNFTTVLFLLFINARIATDNTIILLKTIPGLPKHYVDYNEVKSVPHLSVCDLKLF